MKLSASNLTNLCIRRQETPNLLSVREAAKIFRSPQQKILDLAEDLSFCVNIGLRVGGGIWTHENIGDYELEVLNKKDTLEHAKLFDND